MNEKTSALYSEYVIDGIAQDLTPARMLDACLTGTSVQTPAPAGPFAPVVDETMDPALKPCVTSPSEIGSYLKKVRSLRTRRFPTSFPETYTKSHIAFALIDAIWKRGHFRLDDLALDLHWTLAEPKIGDMTAFYASVASAADYIDSLDLKVSQYSCTEGADSTDISVRPVIGSAAYDDDFEDDAYADQPSLRSQNLHPSKLVADRQSWVLYIPFENSDYRLGASLLAQVLGVSGAVAPQIVDPDYFIDCYEVVRELVEDRIILSGVTVGEGGLLTALKRMVGPKTGVTVDLADLVRATSEKDIVRLLFSEVPGAIIQISDLDYDYVDAELLLQDVAYFPLGHPSPGVPGVTVQASDKSAIQTILESLITSQSSEGED